MGFIALFSCLACRQSNEIVIARRCIMWARLAIVPIFVCHAIQLDFDLHFFSGTVVLPSVSVIRPALGIVTCFVSFFVNSHMALRWFVVVTQPAFIVANFFTAAYIRVLITCRLAGTCLSQGGISLQQLQLYENIQYTGAFFAVSVPVASGSSGSGLRTTLATALLTALACVADFLSSSGHGRLLRALPCAAFCDYCEAWWACQQSK